MWIMTTIGFFSIVQKPEDKRDDTLTIRSRVKSDLIALRDQYLPNLDAIVAYSGTDYQYRARAPRNDVSAALQKLIQAIDYDNFKNAVASRQDYNRASLYGKVWSTLYKLSEKQGEPLISNLKIASNPEILQGVMKKTQQNNTWLNANGESINKPEAFHPRTDDKGKPVKIKTPTPTKPMSAFDDPAQHAVMLPDGQSPASLNGIDFQPWQTAPKTLAEWVNVEGQTKIDEPPMKPKNGKKLAAGVVTIEPDGRFWLVAPTNAFGGYKATFPKGRLEPGMTPQTTAIKEAFEEAGLQVEITGLIGDFERSQSITRYYTARRIGGLPTQMGWESQAVLLVPRNRLLDVLNHPNDHALVDAFKDSYEQTIKRPGGITVRFIEALNGFKTKYDYWPSVLEAEAETIAFLASQSLTPLGFFLLQSKVDLRIGEQGKILAKGKCGDVFDYGDEGWQSENGHKHDARQWLGLDENS
jgi:8-oxo-dGTP pyrophosphatase MutT (NUDIX family)